MSLLASLSDLVDSKQQKDTPISPEIAALVEALKKQLADQKRQRDEIANTTDKPLDDLSLELLELQRSVTCILSGLRRQNVKSCHMSDEVLKLERNSSIIQRSLDMTYDFSQNTPELTGYFKNCISSFGTRVQAYKQEVRAIEDAISSRAKVSLTPKELSDVLRKLDDQFMSLAAQLYSLNEELSSSKIQLLRQQNQDDKKSFIDLSINSPTSPFDKLLFDSEKNTNTPYGPSPFFTTMSTASPSVATTNTGLPIVSGATSQPTPWVTTTASGGLFSPLKPTVSATATANQFTLGTAAPPTTSSGGGMSLGFVGSNLATTTTSTTSFSFGLPVSSVGTSSTGFGFGTTAATVPTATTTSSGGFGFGAGLGGSIFGSQSSAKPLFGSK